MSNDRPSVHAAWPAEPPSPGPVSLPGAKDTPAAPPGHLAAHALEAINDLLILLDRDWRFIYLNRYALQVAGQPPEALLGQSIWEKYPALRGTELEAQYRQAMASQVEVCFETSGIQSGRWYEVRLYPSAAGLTVHGRDITRRRQVEQQLRAAEERHRLIAELTSDYAYDCTVDPDGTIRLEAATEGFTRITGYTLDELRAQGDWPSMIHPDDRTRMDQDAVRLVAGERQGGEVRLVTKGGAVRWIRYSARVIHEPKTGLPVRLLGAVQDITGRKEAEERLRESSARLQALSRRLLEVQEAERRHLARELHDEIGQALTAINLNLSAAGQAAGAAAQPLLAECRGVVAGAIRKVRDLSLVLRPPTLDLLGLEPALYWLVEQLGLRAAMDVEVVTDLDAERLPAAVETACFRVAQEALTNVARHARARQVWVEVRRRDGAVQLTIRDDGAGFDVAAVQRGAAQGGTFGLLGMQERAELLGGRLEVESAPGRGTTVRARLPVAAP
jgi:PAS domain S-box-containing protein